MKIRLSFGGERIEAELPSKNVEVLKPLETVVKDENKIIEQSLKKPTDGTALKEFVRGRKILLIVNDHTRPTPTPKVIAKVNKILNWSSTKIIVATGAHRAPTEAELQTQILGRYHEKLKQNLLIHDCNDAAVYFGNTKFKTEVYLNSQISDADRIVTINSVEPHYFAGYTGGRKSILPGIAGFKTIVANHKLALLENAQVLKLEGNPVNEDMEQAVALTNKEIFGIQLVTLQNKICYAASGMMSNAFKACVEQSQNIFTKKVKEKADIVITVASHPMDIDLYQSQKAIDNAKYILNKDGIIVLVSACKGGIGGKDFYDLLSTYATPQEVLEEIKKNYKFGYHKAAKLAEIMLSAQIWAVTTLQPEVLRKISFKPYSNLKNAIEAALAQKGRDARIAVLVDGSTTIPVLSE